MTMLKHYRTKCLSLLPPPLRVWAKERAELSFWRSRHENEQVLRNDHYRFFYTDFFKLTAADYRGYRVLDVGCGPRGSLEWADMTLERIGLDPLVDRYHALGIDDHSMRYCHAPVEAIPYKSEHFDCVVSFNSLDHVDNLVQALSEINRVTRQGGMFLLIVEVNHPPTPTEPIELTEADLKSRLSETYDVLSWRAYQLRSDHDIYRSLREGTPQPSLGIGEKGIIAAKAIKRSGSRAGARGNNVFSAAKGD